MKNKRKVRLEKTTAEIVDAMKQFPSDLGSFHRPPPPLKNILGFVNDSIPKNESCMQRHFHHFHHFQMGNLIVTTCSDTGEMNANIFRRLINNYQDFFLTNHCPYNNGFVIFCFLCIQNATRNPMPLLGIIITLDINLNDTEIDQLYYRSDSLTYFQRAFDKVISFLETETQNKPTLLDLIQEPTNPLPYPILPLLMGNI